MKCPSSCLWQITYSSEKIIYLFGTIHLPIDSIKWESEKVFSLIEEADEYYGEMNLDRIQDTDFTGQNLIPGGREIADLLKSHKQYHKLRIALLKSFKVDLNDYKNLLPLLIQHILDRSVSGGEKRIMDHVLWNHAISKQIPVHGLETLEDQLKILKELDLDFQIDILKSISSSTKSYHRRIKKLIKDYDAGNIRILYKSSVKSLGKYKDLMVYRRNKVMANKITSLPIGKYFISVGVGHLYGKYGILAKLKRIDSTIVKPL